MYLVPARSQPVSSPDIGEHYLGDLFAPTANIRSLKRCVVARLRAGGTTELAGSVRSTKELTGSPCPAAAPSHYGDRDRSRRSHGIAVRCPWRGCSLTSQGARQPNKSFRKERFA
jgi:hypothetical protein